MIYQCFYIDSSENQQKSCRGGYCLVLSAATFSFGCIMANKRKEINDKYVTFPKGVSSALVKGTKRIVVRWGGEKGKYKYKYFPYSEEGLAAALALNESKRREKEEQGARFGNLSTDEKQAVEIWRAYRDECMRAYCHPLPMVDVIKKALDLVRLESISPLFHEILREYVKAEERKGIGQDHLRKINQRVRIIGECWGDLRICHITPRMVEDFLDGLRGRDGRGVCSPATRRGYMVLLGAIFKHAVKRGCLAENPIEALEKPLVKTTEPEVLTVEECRAVMRYALEKELAYLPALALALFCGVRPAEVARVRYRDIYPGGRDEIFLSRKITKTNFDRRTQLRNAAGWLGHAEAQGVNMEPGEYVVPGDTENRRVERLPKLLQRIAVGAGVQIPRDSLRHTAGTMLAALVGTAAAAEELGNDARTLAKHYRRAVTREEAKAFFEITPASLGM